MTPQSGTAELMPDVDARYELAYQEGVRLISEQHATVDSLRSRSTNLLSAASVVASVLGAVGVMGSGTRPLPAWSVVLLVVTLVLIGAATFAILWPVHWSFGLSPGKMIDNYIETTAKPASLAKMHREGAVWLQHHFDVNEQRLNRMAWIFRVACGLLLVEVIVMIAGVAGR